MPFVWLNNEVRVTVYTGFVGVLCRYKGLC
jgi:hypothetical protein